MNTIKISNWVIFAMLIGIGLLIFALARGCQNVKNNEARVQVLMGISDSLAALSDQAVKGWKESSQAYKDTLEFERGQRMLAEAQKERTEDDLNKALMYNERLLRKYKGHEYTDTTMVQAPKEFVDDCKDCFTRLEITNGITLKYKKEVNDWTDKFKKETSRISGRVTQVEKERDSYRFSVDSLTNIQKKSVSSIKPKGRLYLSWGVLAAPLPKYAGAGLMYQTRRSVIIGGVCYYGSQGYLVGANIHFPLSLKRK